MSKGIKSLLGDLRYLTRLFVFRPFASARDRVWVLRLIASWREELSDAEKGYDP